MRFTKLLLALVLTAAATTLYGQRAKDEIIADPGKAGGVYYIYTYDNPERTPAPKGYKPFYISHYGRHGSRWLLHDSEYTDLLKTFNEAAAAGALSEFGQDVCRRVRLACEDGAGRTGSLTPLGAQQHCDIARRMYESYPEVFRKDARIEARSTFVVRCVLSMAAFCGELQKQNPALSITRTANDRTTSLLNFFNKQTNPGIAPEYLDMLKSKSYKHAENAFRKERMHPERLMSAIFADTNYAANLDQRELMQQLWALQVNEQDTRSGIRFDDLFTPEELYSVWECVNYRYYNYRGPGKVNKGYAEYYAASLLREIIACADSALLRGTPAADLRFGHDGNVMPLTNLLRFEGCTTTVDDPAQIADVWQDYRISPMAANIQLIFYRKKGSDDVLVKILHNEQEVRIPLPSDVAPYYHWRNLREFYLTQIAAAKNPAEN